MKHRYSTEDFGNCLFYAAAGTDLQPLLRYSHLVQTFLYVCVGEDINQETVLTSLREKLSNLEIGYPGALRLDDVTTGLKMDDFDYRWPVNWCEYLPAGEIQRYRETFGRFERDDNWAIDLRLVRQVGATTRNLRLVVLNGEALATYAALSQGGTIAPRIFCSIQTGVLEIAHGIMGRVFGRSETKPTLWVRGLWHDPNRGPIYCDDHARQVLCKQGAFPLRVQTHTNWNSRMSSQTLPRCPGGENPWSNYSLVKTYARHALPLKPCVNFGNGNRSVSVLNRRLRSEGAAEYDRVFAPRPLFSRHLCDEMPLFPLAAGQSALGKLASALGPTPTLMDALAQVDQYAAAHTECRVGLIGCGFEDEGVCLKEWANNSGPKCRLDVFAPEPLDYADLRGWELN